MSDEQRDNFTQNVQQSLRDSENDIDELTLAKLHAARANAIDATAQPKSRNWSIPASLAAAFVLAFVTVIFTQNPNNELVGTDVALLEDIDVLSSNESLDLLENLEFYEWLDSNADNPA